MTQFLIVCTVFDRYKYISMRQMRHTQTHTNDHYVTMQTSAMTHKNVVLAHIHCLSYKPKQYFYPLHIELMTMVVLYYACLQIGCLYLVAMTIRNNNN